MMIENYPKLKYELITPNALAPKRGTEFSSGLDIFTPETFTILPRQDKIISTGIRFEIPFGWDLSVYNKSGVATKKKLIKGAELIDSDYRGELFIHLFNLGTESISFYKHEKFVQLVMRQVWMGELEQVDTISIDTSRGEGGFGSTDKK